MHIIIVLEKKQTTISLIVHESVEILHALKDRKVGQTKKTAI